MIKDIKLGENKFSKKICPIVSIFAWIAFFVLSFHYIPYFTNIKSAKIQQLTFILILYFLMIVIPAIVNRSKQAPKSILQLLRHPYFPPIDDICPSCLDFRNPR